MNASDSAELERICNAVADETLDVADAERLAALLREDPAARRHYRQFMSLHADLGWDYAAAAREPAPAAVSPGRLGLFRWAVAAGFAALLAVGGAAFWLWSVRTSPIAFVEGVSGAVVWSEGPTARPQVLAPGAGLRSGTLMTEGETSTVQLRLNDGTRLTLDGETEIALTRSDLKLVQLRRGAVGAHAPARLGGEPVVIRTTTGAVAVAPAGAELSISADAARTAVEVTAGRVQFQRLVDGRRLALDAAQRATATLDARAGFTVLPLAAQAPDHWRRTYEQSPAEINKGDWLPADAGHPARVRAVPCIVGRRPDGAPIVHYGVTARAERAARATLDRGSTVTIRWRTARPASLNVMLGLHLPDGGFGGNFELLARAAASPADALGWRTTTLRVADFAPRAGRFAAPPPGALVTLLLVTTRETPADLEVAELAIESPAA
jgi:ferric-dicitrate binding protein FerR (iron transport regulator)